MVQVSILSSCCLLREVKTCLNRDKKCFRLKPKWGFAHCRLIRGSGKAEGPQLTRLVFLPLLKLFFPVVLVLFGLSAIMGQNTDQNANEHHFYSIMKLSFGNTLVHDTWLHRKDTPRHLLLIPTWNCPFHSQLCLVWPQLFLSCPRTLRKAPGSARLSSPCWNLKLIY